MTTHFSRRHFLGLAGGTTGALMLGATGCGGSSGPGGSGSLTVWSLQDPVQNPIQKAALKRFSDKAGAQTKLETFLNTAYTQKLRVAMGSPNTPDVLFNWGGGSIRQYVDNGLLQDLTPELEKNPEFKAKFLPSVLEAGQIDGKYYGIPLRGMQPVILFYNKKLFEKHDAQPPTTWAETLKLVDTFKKAGVTPFAVAGAESWTQLMWLEYLCDRIGGPDVFGAIAEGDKSGWADPAMVRAIDAIADLAGRGGFGTNFSSVQYQTGASPLLAKGKAAMHLMGSWEYTNQLDQEPEFTKDGLGWTTFPAFEGGAGDPKAIVGNPTNYFSVSKRSENAGKALDFLKQEMGSDTYVDALIKGGDVPAVADIEARLKDSPNPEFAGFVYDMVRDAPSFQLSWDQAIENKYAQPMLTNLQKVFLGKLDGKGYAAAMKAA
ncbi:extracellular solute-binding protein [Streptomyces pathocidini]|uniref:ABC transporter substrate-binding protein n=1 Tax=Streptomyces pathocidini TaxID=1650571 RepID=UPI0033F545AB